MASVRIQYPEEVAVPAWVKDLGSFHRWVESDAIPDKVRIDYLAGEVWIDMSEEQVWSHNQLKTEFTFALVGLARQTGLGRFFQDGLRIEHPEADLSAVPDGVFILKTTFETMRATVLKRRAGGALRVQGSPDMVLEAISDSSVQKDRELLRDLYWKAVVREYWLVDARKDPLTFDILRHTAKGYSSTRKQGGWMKSAVFGKEFRLLQGVDDLGDPTFTLEVR
jgi:Uma2 family endonuclease